MAAAHATDRPASSISWSTEKPRGPISSASRLCACSWVLRAAGRGGGAGGVEGRQRVAAPCRQASPGQASGMPSQCRESGCRQHLKSVPLPLIRAGMSMPALVLRSHGWSWWQQASGMLVRSQIGNVLHEWGVAG